MKKNRILLAEDKAEARVAFQEGLESHGFEVAPAASVCEALRLISTENFWLPMTCVAGSAITLDRKGWSNAPTRRNVSSVVGSQSREAMLPRAGEKIPASDA